MTIKRKTKMTTILIEDYKVIKAGCLQAMLSVKLETPKGSWKIRDCRIIKEEEKRAWFSLPTVRYSNETGEVCYKTLLELPPDLKKRIAEKALSEWQKLRDI